MHWATKYIGLPYLLGGVSAQEGVDCWGLMRLVYQQEFGIALPTIPGVTAASAVAQHRAYVKELSRDWIRMETPQEGAGVAMSQVGSLHHVGIWIAVDRGKILHCWRQEGVVADTLRRLALRGINSVFFYRHSLWPQS